VLALVREFGFDGVDVDVEVLSGDVVTCNRVLQGVVDVLLGAGIPVSATPELVCVCSPAPATLAPAGTLRGASRE
jgi:hypothetical protein